MYNRYIAGAWPGEAPKTPEPASPPQAAPPPPEAAAQPEQPAFTEVSAAPEVPAPPEEKPRGLGALKGLFGGNIKLPEFNADTILLLVLVYFLVADDSENISDTLLIVGVLLLLGF